jgi:streptogrisin C
MVHRQRRIAIGSALAATALALATLPGTATAEETPVIAQAAAPPAGVLAALERDLGIGAAEATELLAAGQRAAALDAELSGTLDGYAGSWLPEDGGGLTMATNTAAELAEIEAAGATAVLVEHSLAELEAVQAKLERAAAHRKRAGSGTPVRYVDVTANRVVVHATDPAAARALITAGGADPAAVSVVRTAERPQTYYDIIGGDPFYNGFSRCSIGFSVYQGTIPGFVTAGHCGQTGNVTLGYNRVSQGTFRGSIFPGRDMAWVAVNSNWRPLPYVRGPGGTLIEVHGSQQAPVGSPICRTGPTTGWHCGVIQQHNATVSYPQGTVSGLTRTNLCAEPGDSGGPVMSGNQAQGIISGGSGNCSSGGTTYYQPINPILSSYGLTLVTTR